MRRDLLDLHSMAHEIINEDYGSNRALREETIWEWADTLAWEVLEFRDEQRSVYDTLEELGKLAPDGDWEEGEGEAGESEEE